jgi:hypothetical protein
VVGGKEPDPVDADPLPETVPPEQLDSVDSSDVERSLVLASRLFAAGKFEATARDFVMIGEPDELLLTDLRRLGMALRTLGVRSSRVRREGSQVRVYDLRCMSARPPAKVADSPGRGYDPRTG